MRLLTGGSGYDEVTDIHAGVDRFHCFSIVLSCQRILEYTIAVETVVAISCFL